MGSDIEIKKSVILFDGYCNLCNSQVNSILRFDSKKFFYFSNLDSSFSKKVIKENKVESLEGKTIILFHNNKIIIKSNAAIKIAYLLGGFFKIFIIFKILPNFIRDGIYDVISRNRYRWFGKSDSCYIPKKEILDRFIND
jgi:predicted DCC family thiol-disulfide oxidoreductase YuxK